jgi:photosystem II stability/assembly factor-like uncharacterized protein
MKKLWRLGVLFATMCIAGFGISSSSGAAEQAAAKPEPKVKSVTRENIHGVMAPDDKNIWLVGNYGVIFHSSDAGETWNPQKSGVGSLLIDGVFLNAKAGWVAGTSGVILHTADGGETWIKQKTNTDKHLFGICFLNEKLGWAVGEMGLIINTQDGGTTWTVQGQEQDKNLNNIAFADQNTGVVVGETGTMLRTVDGGRTWTSIQPKIFDRATLEEEIERPRQTLYGIIAKDKTTFVACGMDSLFLYSADAGATWESYTAEKNLGVYSLFVKGARGWAVGDRGSLFLSGDGGKTWKFQDGAIKTGFWLRDIAFLNPNKGIAVGATDTIVLTDDGGKTWNVRAGIYYTVKDFPVGKDVTDKLYKPFNLFGSLWRKSLPEQY